MNINNLSNENAETDIPVIHTLSASAFPNRYFIYILCIYINIYKYIHIYIYIYTNMYDVH